METMTRRLAESTAENYGGHFARFYAWCNEQPDRPQALPAKTRTVLGWLEGDVCADLMRVQESSLQPYLSAINSAHLDLEYDRPAVGHAITAYRHGLAHMQAAQQPAGRRAERTYLPAPCVERALLWALELDISTATRRQLKLFRAAVATVFTFAFFAQGGTGAALLDEHVTRSAAGVTVKLEHEKGKGPRQRARAHAASRRDSRPRRAAPKVGALPRRR
jgi:hypothetical protein